eukprot:scaffold2131_cov113-Isochrysis_galbana.AAC.5
MGGRLTLTRPEARRPPPRPRCPSRSRAPRRCRRRSTRLAQQVPEASRRAILLGGLGAPSRPRTATAAARASCRRHPA